MTNFFRDFVPRSTPLPNPDPFRRARGSLRGGDRLFSATRAFLLVLQDDGNLVLYAIDDATLPPDVTQGKYTTALWSTRTVGWPGGVELIRYLDMQDDGNLVLNDEGIPVWSSGTEGNPGAFLRCQDDGNLVIYAPDGTPLWSSNTYAGPR